MLEGEKYGLTDCNYPRDSELTFRSSYDIFHQNSLAAESLNIGSHSRSLDAEDQIIRRMYSEGCEDRWMHERKSQVVIACDGCDL